MVSTRLSYVVSDSNPLCNPREKKPYFHCTDEETEAQSRQMNGPKEQKWQSQDSDSFPLIPTQFSKVMQAEVLPMGILPEQNA